MRRALLLLALISLLPAAAAGRTWSLSGEALRARHPDTLEDILRLVPFLRVDRFGAAGKELETATDFAYLNEGHKNPAPIGLILFENRLKLEFIEYLVHITGFAGTLMLTRVFFSLVRFGQVVELVESEATTNVR